MRNPSGPCDRPKTADTRAGVPAPTGYWVLRSCMDRLLGRHAVLVEFWDFARVHSLRTPPTCAPGMAPCRAGLQVIGVHSPRLLVRSRPGRGGARGRAARGAVPRRARPGPGGLAAIREQGLAGPLPVRPPQPAAPRPLRRGRVPRDRAGDPGVPARDRAARRGAARAVARATAAVLELVRDWTDGEDWIAAADAGAAASFAFTAGQAFAVLSGAELEPGLYETFGTVTAESPGVRLHAVQFALAASAFLISRGSMNGRPPGRPRTRRRASCRARGRTRRAAGPAPRARSRPS